MLYVSATSQFHQSISKLRALVKTGHILRLEKALISYATQALSDSSPPLTHLECWEQQLASSPVGFAGIRRGSDVAPCGFGFSEVLLQYQERGILLT